MQKIIMIAVLLIVCANYLQSQSAGYWEEIVLDKPIRNMVYPNVVDLGDGKVFVMDTYQVRLDSNEYECRNDIFIIDWVNKQKIDLETTNQPPAELSSGLRRIGFKVAKLTDSKLLLYGGELFRDTWVLDLNTLEWEKIDVTQNTVSEEYARSSFGMTNYGEGKVILFGGDTLGGFITSRDTWIFDLEKRNWELPIPTMAGVPERRIRTTMLNLNGTIYLWGGGGSLSGPVAYTDLWKYNPNSSNWIKLLTNDLPYQSQYPATVANLDDENLFLAYPPLSEDGTNECEDNNCQMYYWIFNFTNQKWVLFREPRGPFVRGTHSLVNVGKRKVLMVGGTNIDSSNSNIWLFHSTITSVNDKIQQKDDVIVSHNHQQIEIRSTIGIIDNLILFDYLGNKLQSCSSNNEEIKMNVSNFTNGIYFVKVSTKQSTFFNKISIIK